MKYTRLLVSFILSLFIFSTFAESPAIKFTPLGQGEKLTGFRHDDPKDPEKYELIIRAEGIHRREIFRYSGYGISLRKEKQSASGQWLTFWVETDKAHGMGYAVVELWFVDGVAGTVKKLYSSGNLSYAISDTGRVICIYDYIESLEIPTIRMYQLPEMLLLKRITVDDLRGKLMYPESIIYHDNKFILKFVTDGPESKTVEIPIK